MKFLNFFLILFLISSCNKAEKGTPVDNNSLENLMEIDYPKNWEKVESSEKNNSFKIVRGNNNDNLKDEITLNYRLFDDDVNDLNTFVQFKKEALNNSESIQILNEQRTHLNGNIAHLIEYNALIKGEMKHFIEYYISKNHMIYTLTYTGEVKTDYENQIEVLNILNSLKLN